MRLKSCSSSRWAVQALALLLLAPTSVAAAPHADAWLRLHEPDVRHTSVGPPGPWGVVRSWLGTFLNRDAVVTIPKATEPPGLERPERFRKARYGNDMVLRFNISTEHEATSFAEACDTLFLDVWASTRDWVDVRISEDVLPSLLGLLPKSLQNAHMPLLRNKELFRAIGQSYSKVGGQSNYESFSPALHRDIGSSPDIFFNEYRPWSVLTHWMELMASMFRSHAKLITVGKSFEGRDIVGLRIGVQPADASAPPKRTVLVTGGAHAREWIGTSTVTYIAYSLLTQSSRSATVREMLERFDWVLVPSINPDGYVYTWTNDRLWRKNRARTSLSFCPGIDLDRSFDFHWTGSAGAGNPCSENYAGEQAFDGHEARELATWAKQEVQDGGGFAALLDMHSYSQEVLYPYTFSCSEEPSNLEDLQELGEGLAKAIRRYGSPYAVIPACEGNVLQSSSSQRQSPQLLSAGGSLLDYFYHALGTRLAYQLKLRDTGSWGFLLPGDRIVPVGEEIWDAVLYLGETLLAKTAATKVAVAASEPAGSNKGPVMPLQRVMAAPTDQHHHQT